MQQHSTRDLSSNFSPFLRPPLGVSHWLPHRPFAQVSRQSYYLTASSFPTLTIPVLFLFPFIYYLQIFKYHTQALSHCEWSARNMIFRSADSISDRHLLRYYLPLNGQAPVMINLSIFCFIASVCFRFLFWTIIDHKIIHILYLEFSYILFPGSSLHRYFGSPLGSVVKTLLSFSFLSS